MRQWKTITPSDYVIDNRNRDDILAQIEKLAKSYVPEWQFSKENPDIGSTIAMLYADQMEENLKRYNTTLERDYTELVNMMGVSLKPAYPSRSVVLMDVAEDTIPGIKLSKGIKLIGSREGEENYVFETINNVYVTESKLSSMFYVSSKNGKVIPVKGDFKPVEYVDKDNLVDSAEVDNETEDAFNDEIQNGQEENFSPFTLFDFSKDGYGKNGIVIYHEHLFDVNDNKIYMELKGNETLVEAIVNGEYSLKYLAAGGFLEVDELTQINGERISFVKHEDCQRVNISGVEYSCLLIEPNSYCENAVAVSDIRFSSSGEPRCADTVWDGNTELDVQEFAPFGDTLALYSDVFISNEEYFAKPGARVTIEFDIAFREHMVAMPKAPEVDDLRIIKRKPKKVDAPVIAEIYPEDISIEYSNGLGWRKLMLDNPGNQIFKSGKDGKCRLSFICPDDWASAEVGAYDKRCVRIQLLKADNCYYQPAIHHYPVIKNLMISYSYEKDYRKPSKVFSYQGSRVRNLTNALMDEKALVLFSKSMYGNTALYLGFDRKMEEGPISLFVQIEENEGYMSGNLKYYYYTREGFARLRLTDNTDGLAHTGTIQFVPPTDMYKCNFEGQEAYWIRVEDDNHRLEDHPYIRPRILDISVNAVEVENVETLSEDDYYIDAFGPNMEFAVNAQNILSIEMWVNETALHKNSEMKEMLIAHPDECRAEFNFLGEIEAFYRKWQEVDNFDESNSDDRHFLVDRMNNRIHFGDGVHVMIPRNVSGVAFKIITRCCAGENANLEKETITDSLGNLMFVDRIYNPIKAYGGMNMETIDKALRRGTSILNSRRRLITATDYEREVLNFSSRIRQAKAICGLKKDGTFDPGAVTIVILMEDYMDGPYSFLHMRNRIMEHLRTRCEITMDIDKIEIVEPLYMRISVDAWVKILGSEDAFEVSQSLQKILKEYIDPVTKENWDIGSMIGESQIELRLNMEKGKVLLKKLMVTVAYQDEQGNHETSLGALSGNPYVLPVNGTHHIHF